MRRAAIILALMMLSGCVSVMEGIYDEQARRDCDQARDRGGCYDRLDQHRRERDRNKVHPPGPLAASL